MDNLIRAYLDRIIPRNIGAPPTITITAVSSTPLGGFSTHAITLHPDDSADLLDEMTDVRTQRDRLANDIVETQKP